MSEPSVPSAAVILKILTGVQSGVDISLSDGVYTFGSSPDDDIQVYDISLKPGHAKLRVEGGKVQLAGGQGSLHSNAGVDFPTDGEFQELEPLDIVSAGATRFTTGLPSANWASITRDAANHEGAPAPAARARKVKTDAEPRRLMFAGLMVAAAIFGAGMFWLFFGNLGSAQATARGDDRPVLERVKDAVAQLPLRYQLDISRAVDGVIFVTGFTENPAERRAVIASVQEVEPTARVRLTVLETTRTEIAALLSKNYPQLSFVLDDKGVLTIAGIELNPSAAKAAVDLVRDRVAGLTSIVSNIRTSETLLADVRTMADRSRLSPLVMLRLDGVLIEATGVLPIDKIDPWVGFLQAYASNIAPIIPLRSLVNLQNANGEIVPMQAGPALLLGKDSTGPNEIKVDVSRLANGQFKPEDVFSNRANAARANGPGNVASNAPGANASNPVVAIGPNGQPVAVGPGATSTAASGLEAELEAMAARDAQSASNSQQSVLPTSASQTANPVQGVVGADNAMSATAGTANAAATPAALPISAANRSDATAEARNGAEVDRLLQSWASNGPAVFQQDGVLAQSLTKLQEQLPEGVRLEERYRPLVRGRDQAANQACWSGSRISPANAHGIVFWLDMISVSDSLTLRDLRRDIRGTVLEAALNPQRLGQCLGRFGDKSQSVYLTEVKRNPGFVNFVVRNLATYPLDVVGADLTRDRFIQVRSGDKLLEGSAPDRNSRISAVGELGVAVRVAESFSVVIFGDNVSWFLR